MAATIVRQCLATFHEHAEIWVAGIAARKKKGVKSTEDVAGLLLAYDMWFESLLQIALVHWRHSSGDPAPVLREALAAAREATEFHPRLPFKVRQGRLSKFALAALLCPLVGEPIEPFMPHILRLEEFPDLAETPLQPLCDTVLLRAYLDEAVPAVAQKLAAKVGLRKKPPSLFGRTFDCYTRIIAAGQKGQWAEARQAVQEAYGLYEERKNNCTYKHGLTQLDGGGPNNDLFLDFRLGAIIHRTWQDRREARKTFDPPHRWPG